MIAEHPAANAASLQLVQPRTEEASLSIGRVVASLQLLLAIRRDERNHDYAHWYAVSRGL